MMNRTKTLTLTLFVVVGAVAIFLGTSVGPTSKLDVSKQEILRKGQHPYGLSSKGGGHLEVSLSSSLTTPIPTNKTFTLSATVSSRSSLQNLHFEWVLSEGVTVVSGSLNGSLGDLSPDATLEASIQLSTTSDENHQIHLHVYRMVGGEASGQMTQFNTRDQSAIAADAQLKMNALGMGRSPASTKERRIMQ